MTEQEATDKLETLVGSVNGCFQLMRLYHNCCLSSFNNQPVDERFRKRAKEAGYTQQAINHYLNHIR